MARNDGNFGRNRHVWEKVAEMSQYGNFLVDSGIFVIYAQIMAVNSGTRR